MNQFPVPQGAQLTACQMAGVWCFHGELFLMCNLLSRESVTGWRFLASSSRSLWQVKQTNKQKRITLRNWLVLKSNEFTLGLITVGFSTKKRTYDSIIYNLGWPFRWRFFLFCFSSAYKTGKFKLAPFTRPGHHNTRNVKHARGLEKLQKV